MKNILGLIAAIFIGCFGFYLFGLLPDLFITFKHFMYFAGAICCVGGGAVLGILCVIDLMERYI